MGAIKKYPISLPRCLVESLRKFEMYALYELIAEFIMETVPKLGETSVSVTPYGGRNSKVRRQYALKVILSTRIINEVDTRVISSVSKLNIKLDRHLQKTVVLHAVR